MKVKKLLKKDAKSVLPSEKVRENVMHAASRGGYEVSASGNTAVASIKRKKPVAFLALALIILMVVAMLLMIPRSGGGGFVGNSFVCIDVNPSVEIVLNAYDEVTHVKALNADGAVLLYGENFEGKTKEQTVARIVELLWRGGYLQNNDLRLYIDASVDKEENLYAGLYEAINNEMTLRNVTKQINTVTEDNKIQAKKHGVSGAKYSIALQLSEESGEKIEKLLKMDYEDLYKMACKYDEIEIDDIIAGMEEIAKSTDFNALKQSLDAIEKLEDLLDEIEDRQDDGLPVDKAIQEYNAECVSAGYDNLKIDESLSGELLINRLEELDDLLDELDEQLEDELENIKKQFLNGNVGDGDIDDDDGDETICSASR